MIGVQEAVLMRMRMRRHLLAVVGWVLQWKTLLVNVCGMVLRRCIAQKHYRVELCRNADVALRQETFFRGERDKGERERDGKGGRLKGQIGINHGVLRKSLLVAI